MPEHHAIGYFSMEVGLEPSMPTYSGGLGVLAGDTIRAAADLSLQMVGVTLLHRKGYLQQSLSDDGRQLEAPQEWEPRAFLAEMPQRASLLIEGRTVYVRAWRYEVVGVTGHHVPVFFLDTDLPENGDFDRRLTDMLYGGDSYYRLCQEALLGIGGIEMLRVLGYAQLGRYHMNEGHAALLALALLREAAAEDGREIIDPSDVETVRRQCVFTTHTPVPAGQDKFPIDLFERVIGSIRMTMDWKTLVCHEGLVNMTYMALNLSHYVNGVAKRHGEISRLLFANYAVDSITNGVHAATWVSPQFAELFDKHIPDWRKDNFSLRYADGISREEVWEAHARAKSQLLEQVRQQAGVNLDAEVCTLGFARRATAYKRPDLLLHDPARLLQVAKAAGRLQVIFAGKAHPRDELGKQLIQQIIRTARTIGNQVPIVYLPGYDIHWAKLMTAGVDVWLNTPQPPMEASGTSGMKAALNGVPSLSILDGWWAEGHIEGVTGWAIGDLASGNSHPDSNERDAQSLYDTLERNVLPTYYKDQRRFRSMMVHCIGLNGSFFNTHRMLQQYVLSAYFR